MNLYIGIRYLHQQLITKWRRKNESKSKSKDRNYAQPTRTSDNSKKHGQELGLIG
jgi:hypothetical protein